MRDGRIRQELAAEMTGVAPAGLVGRRGFPCAAFSGLASSSASLIAHMGGDRGNAAEFDHLKGEAAIW
jgi:hypothetical protein